MGSKCQSLLQPLEFLSSPILSLLILSGISVVDTRWQKSFQFFWSRGPDGTEILQLFLLIEGTILSRLIGSPFSARVRVLFCVNFVPL